MTTPRRQGPFGPQDSRPVAAVFEFGRDLIGAYDRSLDLLGGRLRDQPERRHHVCFETDTGYMVVDVWESLEAFEKFGNVLDEIADEFPGSVHVKLHRVHNVI